MGEGESKYEETKGQHPPTHTLLPPLTMKAGAWTRCQRSVQWPVAAGRHCRATCPSIAQCHSSQHTESLWCRRPPRCWCGFLLRCCSGFTLLSVRQVHCGSLFAVLGCRRCENNPECTSTGENTERDAHKLGVTAASATTAAGYVATDHGEQSQPIASPPSPCRALSLVQSCVFSSSFDWRSIRHMINTGPRS